VILDRYIMVLLGGATGSLTRYVVGMAVMTRLATRFPLGTMIINISGCFLIGILMTLFAESTQPHPNWRLALVVGFLGGYTTFSSFEWETLALVKDGGQWLALLNIAGSVVLGYGAVWLGAAMVGRR
jgi:CrcB protein